MKQWTLLSVSLVLIGAGTALAVFPPVTVPTDYVPRCWGYLEADILWCDDFDNYCTLGATWVGYPDPTFPAGCATDGTAVKDDTGFLTNWVSQCSQSMSVHNGYNTFDVINPPFGAIYFGTYAEDPIEAKFHTWSLEAAVVAKDDSMNAVNGTTASPLLLDFYLFHSLGNVASSPLYMELSLDADHAPIDYAMRDCYPEGQGPFPIICQQNRAMARAKALESACCDGSEGCPITN